MYHSRRQFETMHTPAFASAFTSTTLPVARCKPAHFLNTHVSPQTVVCVSRSQDARPNDNAVRNALPLLATGLAALSVLLGPAPSPAEPSAALDQRVPAGSHSKSYASHASRSSNPATAIRVHKHPKSTSAEKPSCPFLIVPQNEASMREGTLLLLEPTPTSYTAENHASLDMSNDEQRSVTGPSRLQTASSRAALPKWGASRTNRSIYSPERLLLLRRRMRPATLGLVGFGAFTSGSVFLRSIAQKKDTPSDLETVNKPSEMCSIVCIHIPFCVPERKQMLDGLTELADSACLVTPSGMAAAARDAAAVLLKENRLLEDSTKFAPSMDICTADDLILGARRFSGHVEIEKHRIDRISGRHLGYDVSPKAKLGQYGVVTLVIATAVGVNLGCYDDSKALVCRLRSTLDAVCRLRTGEVAGMELRWIPETSESRPLTRAQLADSFPCLRVV